MKILVLSDSHSSMRYMRRSVSAVKPDAIIHLGDFYDDGEALSEEFPGIPFYQVPGNCDCYRGVQGKPEVLIEKVFGVKLFMTHGHRHNVKLYLAQLLQDASKCHVDAVLFGHTHQTECFQTEDGMWVMNPGTCGYYGGSAGILEVENGKIKTCQIIRDLG